jgi:hypothetical protein
MVDILQILRIRARKRKNNRFKDRKEMNEWDG